MSKFKYSHIKRFSHPISLLQNYFERINLQFVTFLELCPKTGKGESFLQHKLQSSGESGSLKSPFVSTSKLTLLSNNSQVIFWGCWERITCLLISIPEIEALTLEMGYGTKTETKSKRGRCHTKKISFCFPDSQLQNSEGRQQPMGHDQMYRIHVT